MNSLILLCGLAGVALAVQRSSRWATQHRDAGNRRALRREVRLLLQQLQELTASLPPPRRQEGVGIATAQANAHRQSTTILSPTGEALPYDARAQRSVRPGRGQ